jgi:tetratricopeptide (TPR) repeat protein
MNDIAAMYYGLALARAKERDLTGAINYARCSLDIDPENERAKKLLEICFLETGCPMRPQTSQGGAEGPLEALKRLGGICKHTGGKNAVARVLWRFKAMPLINGVPDGNVRVLNIKACVCAVLGRRKKAARFFAMALERDKGNKLAAEGLRQVCKRL